MTASITRNNETLIALITLVSAIIYSFNFSLNLFLGKIIKQVMVLLG